ncbi:MAG: hypothetical protein H6Q72_389 [Firmicutes bacterium]|nr:hypothetical protein [Bacillota bacterium]
MLDKKAPVIIPCCGIDSVYGLMTQKIALQVATTAGKNTEILGLSYLVNGEIEAVQRITDTPCIIINGCFKECASNVVEIIGGDIAAEYAVDTLVAGFDMASLGDAVNLTQTGESQVGEIACSLIADVNNAIKGAQKC